MLKKRNSYCRPFENNFKTIC